LKENIMASTPLEIVQQLLSYPTDPDNVNALLAPDAKYVSLNFDPPDLQRILPGPEAMTSRALCSRPSPT
jgi:hypothetical protein